MTLEVNLVWTVFFSEVHLTTLIVSPFSLFICLVILSIFLVLNVICISLSLH